MEADTVAEIRRHLAARPEKVFAAFAQAGLVGCWLSPSPEIKLTVQTFDFRVGGGYRFAYHVLGGGVMIVNGTYTSIERPSRIAFTWNIEPPDEHAGLHSEVTVTITASGAGSDLTIRHARLSQAGSLERHRGGWHGALDRLAHLLTHSGVSQ